MLLQYVPKKLHSFLQKHFNSNFNGVTEIIIIIIIIIGICFISIINISTGAMNPFETSRFLLPVLAEPCSEKLQGVDGGRFNLCEFK
jgi:predicted PurR-regulated permease PerM